MLNTFASGQPAGMANTSPSGASRGASTAVELLKPCGTAARPARRSAAGAAGMTPPLALIAARLAAPPAAISSSPGIRRLATTATAAKA